jgi:molecular chaperone DnaJ
MSNPYSVLGISQNATDEEVRTAYKELARKYHPDNYVNNPLADLAAEKMKEVNAAYDEIIRLRQEPQNSGQSNQQSGHAGYGGYGGYQGQTASRYPDVRRLISQGRITEADEILNGIPVEQQDAEWHFLKGQTLYARGWLDDAIRHIQTAALLKPGNPEYQAAVRQFTAAQQGYAYDGRNYAQCSTCDLCTTMMCLNCLCNGRLCC